MRMLSFAVILAPVAAAAQTVPAPAPSSAAVPPAATTAAADKKVCRRQEELGSIIPKRICHSAADWRRIDAQNAVDADRALANRRSGATGGN